MIIHCIAKYSGGKGNAERQSDIHVGISMTNGMQPLVLNYFVKDYCL